MVFLRTCKHWLLLRISLDVKIRSSGGNCVSIGKRGASMSIPEILLVQATDWWCIWAYASDGNIYEYEMKYLVGMGSIWSY